MYSTVDRILLFIVGMGNHRSSAEPRGWPQLASWPVRGHRFTSWPVSGHRLTSWPVRRVLESQVRRLLTPPALLQLAVPECRVCSQPVNSGHNNRRYTPIQCEKIVYNMLCCTVSRDLLAPIWSCHLITCKQNGFGQ